MSPPLVFRPRPAATGRRRTTPDGFSVTVTIGPFVVGQREPDWAEAAAMVIAECKREWDARHGGAA